MITEYAHVAVTIDGIPMIEGTTTKVVEIGLDHIAHGWDAETIQRQHPTLTLGQVHSSLAYFFDHQDEFDRDIARRLAAVDRAAEQFSIKGLRARLLARQDAM